MPLAELNRDRWPSSPKPAFLFRGSLSEPNRKYYELSIAHTKQRGFQTSLFHDAGTLDFKRPHQSYRLLDFLLFHSKSSKLINCIFSSNFILFPEERSLRFSESSTCCKRDSETSIFSISEVFLICITFA